MIDVPPTVRAKARLAGAERWLDDLPALIDGLRHDWGFALGRTYAGATEAFVAEATLDDGTQAVLKLVVPRDPDAARHEITVLRLTAGQGCAALLRADESRSALLLERLGPSLSEMGEPFDRRLDLLADAASRVWRPVTGTGLPTGADKGRLLIRFIRRRWAELDRPCAERTVEHAVVAAERRVRAHDDRRAVLVHGDVHQWNALRAGDGVKLVDPDGLIAEPEYDLGVLMREDPVELMDGDPWERAYRLARRTGTDATAIFEWGVVERVSTGLVLAGVGLRSPAAEMLGAADRIAVAAA